ncbi:Type I secretion system permease/ATPase [Azospirillaceae bacterium]
MIPTNRNIVPGPIEFLLSLLRRHSKHPMRELFARLRRHPGGALRLFISSLIINILGLASSIYVIQVLNRYVSYGVNGTLITLTTGAIIAIVGEFIFRQLRLAVGEDIIGDEDERLSIGLFGLSVTTRLDAFEARPIGTRAEILRASERTESAFGPPALAALADLPFSLVYLTGLFLLAPPLAMVTAGFGAVLLLLAWNSQRAAATAQHSLNTAAARIGSLVMAGLQAGETIRHFRAVDRLVEAWSVAAAQAHALRRHARRTHHASSAWAQLVQSLTGIAVIGVGAALAVDGVLDVGVLVGANIMAARALTPLSRLIPLAESARAAAQTLAEARAFAASTPVEPRLGKIIPGWLGKIEARSLAFTPLGGNTPLFTALSFALEPGGVLVITGKNGSGKTSLLRLMAGLIQPSRGQILVDGVDLSQISLDWWRKQVSYLPQEPIFLEGPLQQALSDACPEASPEDMERVLTQVGLRPLIDRHPQGWNQLLGEGGRNLAPGVRRRLALARALLVDGPLYLLDEPSEGLDRDGAERVYAQMIALARRGKTLVVVSHDPTILRGARLTLNFDGAEPILESKQLQ